MIMKDGSLLLSDDKSNTIFRIVKNIICMSSSNHKLKVGIIGYGVVGKKRHSILKKYKQLKVIAASDVNDESLLDPSKKYSKI